MMSSGARTAAQIQLATMISTTPTRKSATAANVIAWASKARKTPNRRTSTPMIRRTVDRTERAAYATLPMLGATDLTQITAISIPIEHGSHGGAVLARTQRASTRTGRGAPRGAFERGPRTPPGPRVDSD
jgi:hypothetical protein